MNWENLQHNQGVYTQKLIARLANNFNVFPRNTVLNAQAYYGGSYGGYGGSYYSGNYRSGGAKYPYGISGSGTGLLLNHALLRRNARNAYQDSPQARAIVDRYADTVADTGLRLEAMPIASILGLTPEEAEVWSNNVESRFDLYMKDKKQNRSETTTGYQSQRLYQKGQHRDNDIFVRFYYSSNRALQNPLQFEFIDPDQIRGDAFTSTFGPHGYSDGIERDERGREKKYKIWVADKSKSGRYDMVEIPRIGPKSKRVMMIHGFEADYAGQGRGYSRLTPILQEFQNLTDFTLSAIKKAINQSSLVGFIENKDQDPSNPMEGVLTNAGAGPAAAQYGTNPNPSPEAQNVTENSLRQPHCYSVPEATIENPGSTMLMNLAKGDSIKTFADNAPVDSFDKFVDSFTGHLSASRGMPLEVLLMKFNQNFSASRGTLLLFWRTVLIWRDEMAADYLNILYEMWMAGEIAAGRVSAPGWSDPRLRAAWLNNSWIGSPAPDIDPMKTAKARQINLESAATNIEREARALNGSSAQVNIEKNTKLFSLLPVPFWNKNQNQNQPVDNNTKAMLKEMITEIIDEVKDDEFENKI